VLPEEYKGNCSFLEQPKRKKRNARNEDGEKTGEK